MYEKVPQKVRFKVSVFYQGFCMSRWLCAYRLCPETKIVSATDYTCKLSVQIGTLSKAHDWDSHYQTLWWINRNTAKIGVLFAKRWITVAQFWNRVSVSVEKWLEYVKHKQLCSTRRRDKVLMHWGKATAVNNSKTYLLNSHKSRGQKDKTTTSQSTESISVS